MNRFVIYSPGKEVVGMVNHSDGDRAVEKAEDAMARTDLTWDAWENATPADQRQAELLGSIT